MVEPKMENFHVLSNRQFRSHMVEKIATRKFLLTGGPREVFTGFLGFRDGSWTVDAHF